MQLVKGVWEAFIQSCQWRHGISQVCFTIAKYENDIFSLYETSNAFIHAFCHSKVHFQQSEPLKLIKIMLKSFHVLLGLSPVWNRYPKK